MVLLQNSSPIASMKSERHFAAILKHRGKHQRAIALARLAAAIHPSTALPEFNDVASARGLRPLTRLATAQS